VRNSCPFCDARDWTVHDELAITGTVAPDTHAVDPRHGAPLVQVTCNSCAFTAAFSATRIGLLEPDAPGS
jgi:predicted nucleic-acid-binding Zn-ribbon protein